MRIADSGPRLLRVRPVELHVLECIGGVFSAYVQEQLLLLDWRTPDKGAERAGANREEILTLEKLFAPNLFKNCLIWQQSTELTAGLCVLEPWMLE